MSSDHPIGSVDHALVGQRGGVGPRYPGMDIIGWVAVGVTVWTAVSVPVALLVGAAMRTGGRSAVRPPAHVRHRVGCTGRRLVARRA